MTNQTQSGRSICQGQFPPSPSQASIGSTFRDRVWTAASSVSMAGLLSWPLQDGWVRIEHRDMPLPNLPRQLVGARLVHLSDLHYGPFVRAAHLHRYVELVNSMRPDIVALPTQCRHFVGGQYSLGHGRFLYVNRGLSNAMRYRPHHKPEITVFSLCRAGSRSGASDRGEGGTVWKQARHSTSCSADASMSEGGQP